jgi:hypothetical protein
MKDRIAGYFKVDKELLIVFLLVAMAGFIFFPLPTSVRF